MKRHLRLALLLLALLLVPAAAARAQSKPNDQGWQQVNGDMMQPGESFQAKDLVAAAYGFIWVMVAGWVFTTWRRAGAIERDLDALRRRIDERAAAEQKAR
jgi:hypothetical protein